MMASIKRILEVIIVLAVLITVLLLIPAGDAVSKAEAQEVSDEPPLSQPAFREVRAEVSAYTSSVDETDSTPFTTASGAPTGHGTLACPSKYAFGTKVEIAGKVYTCQDRMAQRYRNREVFDMWTPTKKVAYQWGRRSLTVKIYE
jgi:3D (Asp-Asp-Asp) domain-containing protein